MRAELGAALLVMALSGTTRAEPWPQCFGADGDSCPPIHLNVVTAAGNATVSVDPECRGDRVHLWGDDDARADIRQWLDGAWERGRGALCIPLTDAVDEIRITPLASHCSFEGVAVGPVGAGGVLERRRSRPLVLAGCHAQLDTMRFGGVALVFSDGFGFGDAYAEGFFYGVYDGFGPRIVAGTDAAVFRLSDFNTQRYRVEILAAGSKRWTYPPRGDDR